MDNQQNDNKISTKKLVGNDFKILVKCSIILAIILALLIPANIISNLVEERAELKATVVADVSEKWGSAQEWVTPILALPIYRTVTSSEGATSTYTDYIYVAPSNTNWNSSINTATKKRSIYSVQIYNGEMEVKFDFKNINWSKYKVDIAKVNWNEAKLMLGVSEPSSITSSVTLYDGGEKTELLPMQHSNGVIKQGFEITNLNAEIWHKDLSIKCYFNGSEQLSFIPLANKNSYNISSNYKHPSFIGRILPNKSDINNNGFQATWTTMSNLRAMPQVWQNTKIDLTDKSFGIYFKEINDNYALTERMTKYAILFIGLTFGVFFLLETLFKVSVHPLQYLMVGLALIIFYTLLLSFSEHAVFGISYWIAALATIVLIALYVKAIFIKRKFGIGFGVGLLILYSYVYFLIQLEDMALLFGSIAMFILIGLIMYFTRNINKVKSLVE